MIELTEPVHPELPTMHYNETSEAVRNLAAEARDLLWPQEFYHLYTHTLHSYRPAPDRPQCYIAGPMRGYPQFNFESFMAAEAALRFRGWACWNPARIDMEQDGFVPWAASSVDEVKPMEHYIRRDVGLICSLRPESSDAVVVLPGWQESMGARAEVCIAAWAKVQVLELEQAYRRGSSTP